MPDHYVLIGQTPVPEPDLLTWARNFEIENRRAAVSRVFDLCEVSTVFLGLNHQWRKGPPLLFETMAFWDGEGGWEQERCSTWAEAEKQHAALVREVARPASVWRFAARALGEALRSAAADWQEAWRELQI
jgi:hypothetical protein